MQATADSSCPYSREGLKTKTSFTWLVFTGCANPAWVFQRHILSQPQSPSRVPSGSVHVELAHIKEIPHEKPFKIKCSFNSLITNYLLHWDAVTGTKNYQILFITERTLWENNTSEKKDEDESWQNALSHACDPKKWTKNKYCYHFKQTAKSQ